MNVDRASTRQSATLKDVARIAGVSTATVARVLHGNGYVADATRQTVESAIARSGYRLNAVAQRLSKQRSFMIGHVLGTVRPNPFYTNVALAAQEEAARHGCGVLVYNTQNDRAIEHQAVEALLRQRVDCMLFTTVASESNVRLAMSTGIPVVQVERVGSISTNSVSVDNYAGSYDATNHLIELGHRRIAYIGMDPATPLDASLLIDDDGAKERRSVEYERIGGYLAALADSGIRADNVLIDLTSAMNGYYSPERGRAVTARLMSLDDTALPTAIFAGCDLLAAGVIQELEARRLHVPDDLSVIGFDDTYAALLAPPLTSVAQPMEELGSVAVQLALAALESRDVDSAAMRHERLTARLVIRTSTGPPPPERSGTDQRSRSFMSNPITR